jgi:hypothetical protein
MSLEREIVFQLKEQGTYSNEDILKACQDYISDSRIILPITEKRVLDELERYEFLQGYNDSQNSQKSVKQRLEIRLKRLVAEKVKEITDQPETLSVETRIKMGGVIGGRIRDNLCGKCFKPLGTRKIVVKEMYIDKIDNGGDVKKYMKKWREYPILQFCKKCGTIKNEYGQVIPEDNKQEGEKK